MIPAIYFAIVLSVLDGDTLRARIQVWPGLFVETSVRIIGIDTPEIHQPKCSREKKMGVQALAVLTRLIPVGSTISLTHISNDKFGGRMLAQVEIGATGDVGDIMLKRGLAHNYNGKGPRLGWCS